MNYKTCYIELTGDDVLREGDLIVPVNKLGDTFPPESVAKHASGLVCRGGWANKAVCDIREQCARLFRPTPDFLRVRLTSEEEPGEGDKCSSGSVVTSEDGNQWLFRSSRHRYWLPGGPFGYVGPYDAMFRAGILLLPDRHKPKDTAESLLRELREGYRQNHERVNEEAGNIMSRIDAVLEGGGE